MKKIVIIIIIIILMCGCENKNKNEYNDKKGEEIKEFVLKKIDDTKDFVYFNTYRKVPGINEDVYNLETAVINVNSEDVVNVNLEIKSFVTKSFNDFNISNNVFNQGNIISYDYYVTDKYISLLQKYYLYVDGMIGEEHDNVYVISLSTGKVLNNKEILKKFGYGEEQLFSILENKIESEDVAFSLKNIKDDGYSLFVNKDNKLCIVYYEITNDDNIRKELVLN